MVGQNIGKYRVLDRIGRGGMGTVYRAIDETLHREVAIKVLNAELNDPEVAKRFRAEAITVARLSHPGIATIYELFQHEGQWLMVMEFVRGETFEKMVERMGSLSPQRTAELCMQALAALAHAHSMGVVHRDLKPANMMITETGAVKIMDFGIARVTGTEHLTSAGFMMGTPAYMAPEQVMGHEIDARADLYAIGVVFYRMTSGQLPFKGDTPFAMAQSQVSAPPTPIGVFRGDLPSWVEQVVVRSLAKSPEERFQSAVEFHEAFARCLAGLPVAPLYSSSAPTEMMATPPRAMPTGTIHRPITSATLPPLRAPSTPTAAQPETPSAVASAEPTPSAAMPAPAVTPAPPVTAVIAPAAQAPNTVAVPSVPADRGKPKRKPIGPIAIAAAVLVAAGLAGVFWVSTRRSAPLPAPADQPPASVALPEPLPVPPPEPPPVEAPRPAPARAGGPSTVSPATAPTVTGAAPSVQTPADAGRTSVAADPPPIPDPVEVFPEVKFVAVKGRDTSDQDVTMNFGGGEMRFVGRKSGAVMASMPYKSMMRATYVRARDPKWDPSMFSPPQNLDAGGLLRTSKHWLVLQSRDAYILLKLEDSNWRKIYETVEARTAITISRPTSNDK